MDASDTYYLNPDRLTEENTWAWWHSDGPKIASNLMAITFSNGQNVSVRGTGRFLAYTPRVTGFTPGAPPVMRIVWAWRYLPPEPVQVLQLDAMGFNITVTSGLPGTINMTQLIRADRRSDNSSITRRTQKTGGQYWLDNDLFYFSSTEDENLRRPTQGRVGLLNFTDQPSFEVGATTVSVTDAFNAFVMFRPDDIYAGFTGGNIFVPIGRVDWGWSASAQPNENGYWIPAGTVQGPVFDPSVNDFPSWLHTLENW